MKRIGYILGVAGIVCALTTSYVVNTAFASSCCSKDASAAEQAQGKCVVCGKAVEKDKGVQVQCEGKSVVVCCKDCEAAYKKDPCKFCKDEKCEKKTK